MPSPAVEARLLPVRRMAFGPMAVVLDQVLLRAQGPVLAWTGPWRRLILGARKADRPKNTSFGRT